MNWQFNHSPDWQYDYEAYYSPQGIEAPALYKWCRDTFGTPGPAIGDGRWDHHGGWIKLRSDEELTLFLLRWA